VLVVILGHVAISALLHRYLDVDLGPTMASGIFPDVTDKLLCNVLRITPSGRMYGHTWLSVALTTLVVRQVWGMRAARAWTAGYVGHLAADTGGFVPWLFPFRRYEFNTEEPGLLDLLVRSMRNPARVIVESALLVWAAYALVTRPQSEPARRPRQDAVQELP
jgi:hypothetical protein